MSDVIAPLSGAVIAINEALGDNPRLLNEVPYADAWLVPVPLDDAGSIAGLLDRDAYWRPLTDPSTYRRGRQ